MLHGSGNYHVFGSGDPFREYLGQNVTQDVYAISATRLIFSFSMWEGIRVASPLATASKERQSEVHVYRRQTLIGNEHTRISETVDR